MSNEDLYKIFDQTLSELDPMEKVAVESIVRAARFEGWQEGFKEARQMHEVMIKDLEIVTSGS